jgi:phosphate-selective porin OprO and OprP
MKLRVPRVLALLATVLSAWTVNAGEPAPFGHSTGGWPPPLRSTDIQNNSRRFLPVSADNASDSNSSSSSEDDSSDVEDLEERLKEIEEAWSDFQSDLEEKKKEAASKPTLEIGGRIHADYWAYPHASEGIGFFEHPDPALPNFGTDPEDLFAFRRVRLELEGDILETMYWRIQVDFNNPEIPEFKDVYIGFDELPNNQQLQIGIQKRPLGLDHLNSSRFNVFLERPAVVEAFNEDARRPGITMYGHTDDESFAWAYGTYLLKNVTTDGRYRGDAYQASLNARLWGSPWYDESSDGRGYFHWGIAGMLAHPDGQANDRSTEDNQARFRTRPEARTLSRWIDTGPIDGAQWYEILALETIVNVGPWQIVGEAQANWVQRHHVNPGPDLFFYGGYVYVSYFLTGEHIPYDRTTGMIGRVKPFENFFLVDRCSGGIGHSWGAWNIALRYDYISLSDGDITGGTEGAGTLAVNWHFNPYAKLQFNLIYGNIEERGPIGGFDSGSYLIAGTRLAIDF